MAGSIRDIINQQDDEIYDRFDSYLPVFEEEVERYAASNGLVPGGGSPEVAQCSAQYFPTQPSNSTKFYALEISVYINGSGVQGGHPTNPTNGAARLPTAAELDRNLIRSASPQNTRIQISLDARSTFCQIHRVRERALEGNQRFLPCDHSQKYYIRLMSDTYVGDSGDYIRGYWVAEGLDPDHPSLINEANANAYGNSLGRPVARSGPGTGQFAPDTTEMVTCRNFLYTGPLLDGDEQTIDRLLVEMETRGVTYNGQQIAPSHRRTGYNNLIFEQIWYD
ncbi:hypothetical protein C8N43_0098 [Litoreibacter ponti]|uniref:Uncharacterized protein n=1 Tax=Litoreibacter ponti TaxID=1510457 RepID=A0A2T6BHC4_9RHOB|nr:hypothetical protein [Litoreibacter ponti]PTX55460.1 hypothetical protein C8N43_0098 [Litoreibacter ponti]